MMVCARQQKIFVQTGLSHVYTDVFKEYFEITEVKVKKEHIDKEIELNQQAVQQLYDELAEFEDENPYAILSCTLR